MTSRSSRQGLFILSFQLAAFFFLFGNESHKRKHGHCTESGCDSRRIILRRDFYQIEGNNIAFFGYTFKLISDKVVI